MALINCPECVQQMSNTAKKCPHCGYRLPLQKRSDADKTKILGYFLFLLGLGTIFPIIYHFFEYQFTHLNNPINLFSKSEDGPMVFDGYTVGAFLCIIIGIISLILASRILSKYYRYAKIVSYFFVGVILLVSFPIIIWRGFTTPEGKELYEAQKWEEYLNSKNNPYVDKYIEILEKAYFEIYNINSPEELTKMKSVIDPNEAYSLKLNSKDYILSPKDKERLKIATDNLFTILTEKQLLYGGFSEEQKRNFKESNQLEEMIRIANISIDNAKTLGDVSGIN